MQPCENSVKALIQLYAQAHPGCSLADTVIFGAGERGLGLLSQLQKAGCAVSCFCDNHQARRAQIAGVRVIPFDELEKIKDRALVLVSPAHAQDIYKQLRESGFRFVFPEELTRILKFIPSTSVPGAYRHFYPIGHFYSLYPDLDAVMEKQDILFDAAKETPGIDFNLEGQCALYDRMRGCYATLPPWPDLADAAQDSAYRYRFGNLSLSAADAVHLHCMLRVLKPKRFVEVGSGYTSAMALDTNQFFFGGAIGMAFIEPYPQLLQSLLKPGDRIELHACGLQEMPPSYFDRLESGDVLFIDSTHVSKIGSDVNAFFFEIFPRLKSGVYIHLHDIFYPFEYPKQWIKDGMIWNELYLLRAFLQHNRAYSVQFFQNMLEQVRADMMLEHWPLRAPIHGGSFWMRKE